MKNFCCWEVNYNPKEDKITREKILLVCNDNEELTGKYNLTKMGLEHLNSYKNLIETFGSPQNYYDYKEGKLENP